MLFFADLRRIREGVDIETREVSRDTDLPVTFSRVATDENLEQMKRFDKGIELLGRIDNNTSLLVDLQNKLVDGQNKLVDSQNKLVDGQNKSIDSQNKLMDGQNKLVDGQTKVVTLLEKIESKIK